MSSPSISQTARIAGLDGLRVIAVLAVFAFHGLYQKFPGGQIGVDVFFVLSGFVITRLLIAERSRAPKLDIWHFYKRRWLRLMPGLTVVFLSTEVSCLAIRELRPDAIPNLWAPVYLMNIYRAVTENGGGILAHSWSLGIEEQFYIVWPAILIIIYKLFGSTRALAIAALVGATASAIEGLVLNSIDPSLWFRIYNAPDTRAVELLAGCALAAFLSESDKSPTRKAFVKLCSWLCWPACALFILFILRYHEQNPTGTVWQLVGVTVGSVVVITTLSTPTHAISRALGWRPISMCGARYSYGFYLCHYPILVILAIYGPADPNKRFVIGLVLTMIASWCLWWAVERHFQKRSRSSRGLHAPGHDVGLDSGNRRPNVFSRRESS